MTAATTPGDIAPVPDGVVGALTTALIVQEPKWATPFELELRYEAGRHEFVETIRFPVAVDSTATVERLARVLAVLAGVSYHKAVGTRVIRPAFALTTGATALASAIYDHGMREFAFANGLPIPTGVDIDAGAEAARSAAPARPRALLVPFGAGRDSTLLAARLASEHPVLFRVGADPHSAAVADELGLDLVVVERTISPNLLVLNGAGAPNGHIPITAINSLIAALYADVAGLGYVAMANERASSAPTIVVDGHEINHQFSKSWACEVLLRDAIAETGSVVDYFSALRSWSEDEIAAAFAALPTGLHRRFMSCNKAFLRDPKRRTPGWCGRCAKCASTYLSLAPHLAPDVLVDIFGSDLLADPALSDEFAALITESDKPFECVSEVVEARRAMRALTGDPAWAHHVTVMALGPIAQRFDDGEDPVHIRQPTAVPDFVETLVRDESAA